jgi:phage FluMu protein Com
MERSLKLKCSHCGHWNSVQVNKVFIEQETSEPKVKAYIPMYEPLKTKTCKKCGKVIAEPRELIRILKGESYV